MTLRLFTPGHSLYTDTLILYGMAIPLCELFEDEVNSNPSFVRTRNLGHFFELEIDLDDCSKVAETVSEFASEYSDTLTTTLTSGPLGFFSDRDIRVFVQALTDEGKLNEYLRSLSTPGHAERSGEGRGGRGKTVKLPLMPIAGKYLHEDLTTATKYPPAQYKACNYCSALAALGLAEAAFPSVGRARREWSRVIVLMSFEGETDARYYAMLTNYRAGDWEEFYRKLQSVRAAGLRSTGAAAQLPLRTLMKLVVSAFSPGLVRAMAMTNARWHALGVCFAGRPKAPQVRGFHDLEITALIDGLSVLYERGGTLIKDLFPLLGLMIEGGEGHALEALLDFISGRSLEALYAFARGAYSVVEWERAQERGRARPPGKGRWISALNRAEDCRELARKLLVAG